MLVPNANPPSGAATANANFILYTSPICALLGIVILVFTEVLSPTGIVYESNASVICIISVPS